MATLTLGTCNFGDDVFENSLPTIRAILERIRTFGIVPELEIFDDGMLATADVLFAKGLLTPPAHFDFVLGVPGAAAATPENLLHFARSIPAGCTWTVAGIGRRQTAMATLAIAMGGHVRVGFEDNIYYRKGELADSNARFVERVVRIAREVGREPASIAEARHDPPPAGRRVSARPTRPRRRRPSSPGASNLWDTSLLVLGLVIGGGIFLTPTSIAKAIPSAPWILAAWIVGGLLAIAGGFVYAEMGAMMPRAGGMYVYIREAFGELPAFLYAWVAFWIIIIGSDAAVAVGFSTYLAVFFPVRSATTTSSRSSASRRSRPGSSSRSALTLVLSATHYVGVREGARIQGVFTVVICSSRSWPSPSAALLAPGRRCPCAAAGRAADHRGARHRR